MSADPFVAQLAELCRQHPTRAKWVFVPTHAVGLTIGDRLAREGTNWVNLHFVTPLDIAIPMAAPFLLERGIDPSEEPLGPPLIMRLLLELPLEGGYFRPVAEHASMADALWRTIRELRFAGLGAGSLPAGAFRTEAKFRELATLMRDYETHLERTGTADMAMVFGEALKHREACPIRPEDVRVELPDEVWAPVVRRFVDSLPGRHVRVRTVEVDSRVPRRIEALAAPATRGGRDDRVEPDRAHAAPSSGSGDGQFQLPFADAPGASDPALKPGASVEIFHAGGHDAEIEEIIRRILSSGRRLDEIEIVCSSDTCALVAWEKARRLDWPVTTAVGIPTTMTRPGRALHAWCGWIESGFAAADLRRMLESGDVRLGEGSGDRRQATGEEPCSAQQAAKILRRSEARWGRATYRASLTNYADKQERLAAEGERADESWRLLRAAQSRWLIRTLKDLLAPIPDPAADGFVAVADLLDAAQAFVGGYARRSGDLDAAGYLAVLDAIQSLQPLGPVRGPLSWALRFLTDAVQAARIARSRSKPGHLHISGFADAGYDGRAVAFVCGLEEARVFPAAVEDPVLLDAEREAIDRASPGGVGTYLRTSGDRIDEAVYAGLARTTRLGACSSEIVLSYSAIDTREFREAFPSWLVLRAYRAASGNPRAGYHDLRRAVGEPASVVPATRNASPTAAAWWLGAARIGGRAIEAVAGAYPGLGSGLAALAARESNAFTEFDGYAPEAGRLLDPSRNEMVVSATVLESAADCPFRFFLETGLGIEPLDEDEADADVWLDPLRRGSELHALYAALLRRARAGSRRVSAADDFDWFITLGRKRLDELRQELPPPSEEVAARETTELLEDLRLFVTAEEAVHQIEPVAFEVSFGRPVSDEGESLASPDPVVFDLGKQRRLIVAGRIDRIDRILTGGGAGSTRVAVESSHRQAGSSDPALYRVVDYKTGRFNPKNYAGTFRRGTLLQHALYGAAAERLLTQDDRRAEVTGGVYWHPTSRGWGRHARIAAPSRASLERVLAMLCDVLGRGVFLQAPERQEKGQRFKKDACRYCDFKLACGAGPAPVAARKAQVNADDRLAPWLALQEVD